jgi:regulator of sigma E protease
MSKLYDILISLPAFIVGISILVAVHEFGHFWVARRLGIKTLRFSIGFGKVLWSRFGKDGTEYAISAIPLGGYVRMLDERDGNVSAEDLPRSFMRQPVWKRVAVLFAGPGLNFVFAIVMFWVLLVSGVPAAKPVIGEVAPQSIASTAGLQPNDEVTAVDGQPVNTQGDFIERLLSDLIDDGVVTLAIRRDGDDRTIQLNAVNRTRELTEPNALFKGLGFQFWRPSIPTVIGSVEPGSAAEKAGIKADDRILSVDGRDVTDFASATALIRANANREVVFSVQRSGEQIAVKATVGSRVVDGQSVGFMGIGPKSGGTYPESMKTLQKESVLSALPLAVAVTWQKTKLMFKFLWHLVTGNVSGKSISGAIGIADVMGQVVQIGVLATLEALALISISIGALNLLPVPLLDGGQIVYQLAELLKGRPVSEKAQLLGQQVGIVLLGLLMIFALSNDIVQRMN